MDADVYKILIGGGWYCSPPLSDGDDPNPGEGEGGDGQDPNAGAGGGTGNGDDDPAVDDPYTEEEKLILSGQKPTEGEGDPESGDGGQEGDPASGEGGPTPAPWETKIAELEQTIKELKDSKEKEEPSAPAAPTSKDPRNAKVDYEDTKHPYHGKTLGQIYDLDPDEAYNISPRLANQIYINDREASRAEEQRQQEDIAQVEREKQQLRDEYAKLELGKEFSTLDAKDQAAVNHKVSSVTQWMLENNKFGITVSEAYFLMDREAILAKAASKATDKVIKDATSGKVTTINTKKDSGAKDGGSDDMSTWDAAKMSRHMDSLDGPAYSKFLKTAPKAVRDKFPSFPWS